VATEACFLYCFAIGLLINGKSEENAYNETKKLAILRANESGNNDVKYWFENELEM
jgi:hypothetical protein